MADIGATYAGTDIDWVSGWSMPNGDYRCVLTRLGYSTYSLIQDFHPDGTKTDVVGGTSDINSMKLNSPQLVHWAQYPETEGTRLLLFQTYDGDSNVYTRGDVYVYGHVYDSSVWDGSYDGGSFPYSYLTGSGVTSDSVLQPVYNPGDFTTSTSSMVRIDTNSYLVVTSMCANAGNGDGDGANFWAARFDCDLDALVEAPIEDYSTDSYGDVTLVCASTVAASVPTRTFLNRHMSEGVKVAVDDYRFFYYDDDGDPIELSVNPWTCEVTVDESPDLSVHFAAEEMVKDALIGEFTDINDYLNNFDRHNNGDGRNVAYFYNSGVAKTIEYATAKSRLITSSGIDAASEDDFVGGIYGTTWAPTPSNGWPRGSSNYQEFGRCVFYSAGSSGYYHPYVFNPPDIDETPGDECGTGPGGAGYTVIAGDDVNSWYLVDNTDCTPLARGSLPPTGLLKFRRLGRLIWIIGGGAVLGGYIIPQSKWDNLSIADQYYVGYYTGGSRDYSHSFTYESAQITIPEGALSYGAGYWEGKMFPAGTSDTLFSKYGKKNNGLAILVDGGGNGTVSTFLTPAELESVKVVQSGRADQESLTYSEALSAAESAGTSTVIEASWG